jgi:glycosyltransferase involved in cell wall biosynthesis
MPVDVLRMAHILGAAADGGAELFFERLTAALARAGDAVTPVIRRHPARAARLRAAGLAPVELGFGGLLDRLTRLRLAGVLRAAAPAVVVAWMSRAARHTPAGDYVLAGRLGGYYDLRNFARCDHLIGNTRAIVDWIVGQGVSPARVHHLPNFSPDFRGAPRAPAAPAGPFVLAAGRLHRNKAFDVLIRAMARLPREHQSARLVIAGEGPERAALEQLARQCGVADRVVLPGWQSDTAGWLAACDVLVCPSRHEPLGNIVIEAFSATRPVVAAAIDGPAMLVTPEVSGLLVPAEDDAALAAAISRVLDDPALAARLAAGGRAAFEARHAEAPVVTLWRDGLRRMAAG